MKNYYNAMNSASNRACQKGIWLACFTLFCLYLPLNGQVQISISPNPATAPEVGPFESILTQAFLTHLSTDTTIYRWTRTVVALQGGASCLSSVLDKYISWAPSVSSRTFVLGPNETNFPLFVELHNGDSVPCCALIHLKIHPEGDTSNTVTAAYVFGNCVSSAIELATPALQIKPNPVSSSFSISGKTVGTSVQLFHLDGRLLQTWDSGMDTYTVSQLVAGTYVLVLLDEKGRAYRALTLIKQ